MHVVNINDAFLDRAMCESLVLPTLDNMAKRGYPRELAEQIEKIRSDLKDLQVQLAALNRNLVREEYVANVCLASQHTEE